MPEYIFRISDVKQFTKECRDDLHAAVLGCRDMDEYKRSTPLKIYAGERFVGSSYSSCPLKGMQFHAAPAGD